MLYTWEQMSRQIRYDRVSLGTLGAPIVTEEGFLLLDGYIAQPGVLVYRNADGSTTRELVLPEELSSPEAIATLVMKPVTIEHPPEPVTPANAQVFSVGTVGNPTIDFEGKLRARLSVHRADAIEAIQSGKQELSPGYSVIVEPTSGTHELYGPYDGIQRDRRYNHAAIVDKARGGPNIRLRVDSAIQIIEDEMDPKIDPITGLPIEEPTEDAPPVVDPATEPPVDPEMTEEPIADPALVPPVDPEVPEEEMPEEQPPMVDIDAAMEQLTMLKAKLESLEATITGLQEINTSLDTLNKQLVGKVDSLEKAAKKEREDSDKIFLDTLSERDRLLPLAVKFKVDTSKMTNEQIIVELAKKVSPHFDGADIIMAKAIVEVASSLKDEPNSQLSKLFNDTQEKADAKDKPVSALQARLNKLGSN